MAAEPLVREIFIAAPPERVFAFLVDPAKMVRWIGVHVELDARPGGILRIDPNGRDVASGKVLEVVPSARLVFTWGWENSAHGVPPGSTVVEFDLAPEGAGTRLTLTHRDLPDATREDHGTGWTHYLGRLRILAAGGDPEPDPLASPDTRHG